MTQIWFLLLIALAWVVWRAQSRCYFTQYLFFLRYPVLAAVALVLGPISAQHSLTLGNLFVLKARDIVWVTLLVGCVASAIMYVFTLIFGLSAARVK